MTDLPFPLSGLWHVHTDRTDGCHSPERLVAFADEARFPLIGFTEHVRRELTYDFADLAARARGAAADRDVECLVGIEAKVLDTDGTLDVDPDTLDRADVVYAAYHGTPFSRSAYVESVHGMLSNPAVDVWAHPFRYPDREGFDLAADTRESILAAVADHDVRFELNLRRPTTRVGHADLAGVPKIVGYDLHDIDRW